MQVFTVYLKPSKLLSWDEYLKFQAQNFRFSLDVSIVKKVYCPQ